MANWLQGNLFGWSESLWLFIDRWATLFGLAMGVTWFLGLILALFNRESLRQWFFRNRFPNVGTHLAEDTHWDGMIFTVSRAELPLHVIRQLRPEHIGLIASRESKANAEKIQASRFEWNPMLHGILVVENPDDPANARDVTHRLRERMQHAGATNCAVDITGGKLPMSVGAFMAAEEAGLSTLYLSSRYDPKLDKPDPQTTRIHCISRPE